VEPVPLHQSGAARLADAFNRRFAHPIEQHKDQDARARLRQLLRPFILRRLKSEVLSELPPRTEITLTLELSDSEMALYEAMRREAVERLDDADVAANPGQQRMQLLAEIMRLRRACCHPRLALPDSDLPSSKLDAFAEIVDELLENRHKALVFSQFVDHLKLIREHLDARGIRYQYLDGSTPEPRRRAAVNAFQAGDGDLFLISLRAGGAGLNLTAADYVIHMDPWWNPAVEDQASDRAHRIGQQRPVTIYRLVAKDTIEERILKLHANKRDLADALLEGTDDTSRLSYADMLALVQVKAFESESTSARVGDTPAPLPTGRVQGPTAPARSPFRIGPKSYIPCAAPWIGFASLSKTRGRSDEPNRPVGYRRRCDAGERGCSRRH
jgi:SNF2 family DNA or RNA helicase